MSFDLRLDASPLTVLLDVRHPLCHLALAPTIAFGRERSLAINWLPVATRALRPPPPDSVGNERSVAHRRNRARMIAREIAVYAEAQGLEMVDYYRDAPAPAVHLGWMWVRAHGSDRALEAFMTESFRAYWSGELDGSDLAAVTRIVGLCVEGEGLDATAFGAWAAGEGPDVIAAAASELETRGLAGAPLYAAAGQIFLGRQHLPMIGWLLDGEQGPGPI